MPLIDHEAVIRLNWHDRHNEVKRLCIRRSIIMLKSFRKNGIWVQPPVSKP